MSRRRSQLLFPSGNGAAFIFNQYIDVSSGKLQRESTTSVLLWNFQRGLYSFINIPASCCCRFYWKWTVRHHFLLLSSAHSNSRLSLWHVYVILRRRWGGGGGVCSKCASWTIIKGSLPSSAAIREYKEGANQDRCFPKWPGHWMIIARPLCMSLFLSLLQTTKTNIIKRAEGTIEWDLLWWEQIIVI